MAANVRINRWSGPAGSPVIDDITDLNSRIDCLDAQTVADLTAPVYQSFSSLWAVFRLEAVTAPAGTINNIRFFAEDTFDLGTDISVNVGLATSYIQATPGIHTGSGTVLNLATYPTLQDQGGSVYVSDMATWVESTPLAVAGSTAVAGDFGDFIILQVFVGAFATSGESARGRLKFSYDEM